MLIITSGNCSVNIDFKTYNISIGDIIFIAPGQLCNIVISNTCEGYHISFSEEYVWRMSAAARNLTRHTMFCIHNNTPVCHIENDGFSLLLKNYQHIHNIFKIGAENTFNNDYLATRLSILLYDVSNYCVWGKQFKKAENTRGYKIYSLVELNC